MFPPLMQFVNARTPSFVFSHMAMVFVGMYSICFVIVLFLIPARPYRPPSPELLPTSGSISDTSGAIAVSESGLEDSVKMEKAKRCIGQTWSSLVKQFRALWKNIGSPLYLPIVAIQIINMIRNNFYLASASKQLGDRGTNALSIVNILAFIPGPILGLIVDKWGPLVVIAGINTTNILVFIAVLGGQLCSSSTVASTLNVISTILALPGIGFLLSQMYCYVSMVFPPEDMVSFHYSKNLLLLLQGKLAGFASFVAGLCGLVVNPMYSWSAYNDSFWEMDVVSIGISLVNYVLIIFLVWKIRTK